MPYSVYQKKLYNYLTTFNILSDNEVKELIAASNLKVLDKSDYYIREGEICNDVAFVIEGTLRSYYFSNKGEEITYCITFPNNLLSAYSSLITGKETEENIQAITQVKLLVFSKDTIDTLALKYPNWIHFMKIIAEQQYIELEKRIFQLQKSNALQRYSDLLKNQPEYLKHIPLQYLASYLGITQRHLSRIRKEIAF
jgi:CRP-like cAMP-binding protein